MLFLYSGQKLLYSIYIYNRELLASVVPEYSVSRWVEFGLNFRSLGVKIFRFNDLLVLTDCSMISSVLQFELDCENSS